MITDAVRGDIFQTSCLHIAFAVNVEGYNDDGFAGFVSSRYWSELTSAGQRELGDVISKRSGEKILHALVCHSLDDNGWIETAEAVTKCLDSLDVSDDDAIALVLMGTDVLGQMANADVFAILGGIARSKKKVVIYERQTA